MSIRPTASLVLFVFLAFVAAAQTTQSPKKNPAPSAGGMVMVQPGSEQWGDIPDGVLVGKPSVDVGGTLKVAILQGDPSKPTRTYTVLLSCTDGAKIAPHWHPTTENVTVMRGAAAVGMGSKWDDAALKEMPTGSFFSAPPQMRHFAQCKGDTVLQIHGVGPLVINFVGPDETPAKQPT